MQSTVIEHRENKPNHKILSFAVLQALGLAATSVGQAQIIPSSWEITVGSTADAEDAAGCSLRQAVISANLDTAIGDCELRNVFGRSSDTIVFDPSVVPGAINLTLGELVITSDVTIQGPGLERLIVTANYDRMLRVAGANNRVELNDLTLTRGNARYSQYEYGLGGAIFNQGTLTLRRSKISQSSARRGGAIFNQGILTLSRSEISLSNAYRGGAIFNAGGDSVGVLSIDNTVLSRNQADVSGGAILNAGELSITRSILNDNTAVEYGAAISIEFGNGALMDTRFSNNTTVYDGGDLRVFGASRMDINGCTFVGSPQNGGATILVYSPAFTLFNLGQSTLSNLGNRAMSIAGNVNARVENSTIAGAAHGVAAGNGVNLSMLNTTVQGVAGDGLVLSPNAIVTLRNSIFAGSAGDDCVANNAIFLENSFNIFETGNCIDNQNGLIFADPMLGPLQDNGGPTWTMLPLPGSPAIDAGDQNCLLLDQRGFDRLDGQCDIGPIELGAMEAPLFSDGFE